MSIVCTRKSHVYNLCDTRMYAHLMHMSLVWALALSICTRMSSVCHSYVIVCHLYVTRMYSFIIRMSLLCTPYVLCYSYVLICHLNVTPMYSYVIRMSLVGTGMSSYVTRMWFYHEPFKQRYYVFDLTDLTLDHFFLVTLLHTASIIGMYGLLYMLTYSL